jgi:hypothetical protein
MVRKPFAAFGRILYANYYDAGNVVDVATSGHSETVLFVSNGSTTVRNKQTGEVVWEAGPGWFSDGNYQDNVYTCTANTATVCWCYDPEVNQGYVPPISVFELKQGQSMVMDAGTNLFLCRGDLLVNAQQYASPYQLAVRTRGNSFTAVTDVYGLLFI